MRTKLLSIILIGSIASAAIACDGPIPDRTNDRISIAADCSYERASPSDMWSGRPTQDIGNGLVVQRQTMAEWACDRQEVLQIVDCNSNLVARLFGEEPPYGTPPWLAPIAGMRLRLVDTVLYPTGRLVIRQGDSLLQIAANAEQADVRVEVSDVSRVYEQLSSWDRPDPMCGCRLFYPDSLGARQ